MEHNEKTLRQVQQEDLQEVLFTPEQLDEITTKLAETISRDYTQSVKNGKNLVLVPILKGSVLFAADLMKKITLPCELEFMKVSSYGNGTASTGEIRVHLDILRENLRDLDILIIEDIVDSGRTLSRLTQMLKNRGANSVKTVTMLDKPSRREVPFSPDYCGAVIPNHFVVGYGLDYDEKYRTLPYIGILKPEIYS